MGARSAEHFSTYQLFLLRISEEIGARSAENVSTSIYIFFNKKRPRKVCVLVAKIPVSAAPILCLGKLRISAAPKVCVDKIGSWKNGISVSVSVGSIAVHQ